MKAKITRAKRYKLTYASLRKMSYLAGFAEGVAQERRMVDRLNKCAFEGWNRAMGEATQLENERDEARRELEKRDTAVCGACKHSTDNEGSFWCEQLRRAVEYDWFCKGFKQEEK